MSPLMRHSNLWRLPKVAAVVGATGVGAAVVWVVVRGSAMAAPLGGVVALVVFIVIVGTRGGVGASWSVVGRTGVGVGAAVGAAGSLEGALECSTCPLWANSSPGA